MRLVEAVVEVDGKPKRMIFITDNLAWAASSICDLYKARWAIEVFFKEIKQTLQLFDFMGYNENAVRWQIRTVLLTYVLLRFIAWKNEWKHTFTRLFTTLRGVVWSCLELGSVLKCSGTASDPVRMRAAPEQAYLPQIRSNINIIHGKGTGNGYSQKKQLKLNMESKMTISKDYGTTVFFYSVGFNTSPLGATLCSSFFPFLHLARSRAV